MVSLFKMRQLVIINLIFEVTLLNSLSLIFHIQKTLESLYPKSMYDGLKYFFQKVAKAYVVPEKISFES